MEGGASIRAYVSNPLNTVIPTESMLLDTSKYQMDMWFTTLYTG